MRTQRSRVHGFSNLLRWVYKLLVSYERFSTYSYDTAGYMRGTLFTFCPAGGPGGVLASERGVSGFGSPLGDSSSSLSLSRSRPGRKASSSFSTLSSVGVHLENPALFWSHTTSVPCADLTFRSALQHTCKILKKRSSVLGPTQQNLGQ